LGQGNVPVAERLANEVWDHLRQSGASGLEFPLLAYESCARVFEATGNRSAYRDVVEAAHHELLERAERISDAEWRNAFLHNVPEHRALVEMWEQPAD
jgi:hypothetical protein